MTYDVVIVGAGSAGCVLASRLTEDTRLSVCLLEAGPDYPDVQQLPDDLKDANDVYRSAFGPHTWGYRGTPNRYQSRPMAKPRGKVVGGTSAINGAVLARGAPEDYEQWAARGSDEWSWEKVLPYFLKLERDQDFRGPFHGSDGPLPVRRYRRDEWLPMCEAFYQACRSEGFPDDPDQNQPDSTGVGPLPRNVQDGVRISTALAYLQPARSRPNLTVRPDTRARRVLFEGRQARAVETESGAGPQTIEGKHIVLCAGAIESPHLLMLSGVGPEGDLQALGIPVVHHLPGVGQNLQDHPLLLVLFRAEGLHTDRLAPFVQVALRYTLPGSKTRNDMILEPLRIPSQLVGHLLRDVLASPFRYFRDFGLATTIGMAGRGLWSITNKQPYFAIGIALRKPSNVGHLRLASRDPHVQPMLTYSYLEDPWDRERMRHGVRLALRLARQPPLNSIALSPVFPSASEAADDRKLDRWMLRSVATQHHDAGTCKMGPPSDPMAVVDQHCRVRGVEGLRVVDTSVMPELVRANTNAPAIMIAERVAEWMALGR